jgi:hypothetical protein
MRFAMGATAGVLAVVAAATGLASATPQTVVAAKKAGLPVTNCQYCHTTGAPMKETWKPEELNDRGKFLRDDMKARNLKAPDVEKLKEYKGTK